MQAKPNFIVESLLCICRLDYWWHKALEWKEAMGEASIKTPLKCSWSKSVDLSESRSKKLLSNIDKISPPWLKLHIPGGINLLL